MTDPLWDEFDRTRTPTIDAGRIDAGRPRFASGQTRDVILVGGPADGRTYVVPIMANAIRIPVLTKQGRFTVKVLPIHSTPSGYRVYW